MTLKEITEEMRKVVLLAAWNDEEGFQILGEEMAIPAADVAGLQLSMSSMHTASGETINKQVQCVVDVPRLAHEGTMDADDVEYYQNVMVGALAEALRRERAVSIEGKPFVDTFKDQQGNRGWIITVQAKVRS